MTQEEITQTNCIICGDCRDHLPRIPDGSVDLIYLDPPFFSGKDYEIIWDDGSEIRSFTDTEFYTLICECGDIFPDDNKFCAKCGAPKDKATEHKSKDIQAYLQWIRPRLEQCKRVLNDTGSIYCHLDGHAVHYVKVIMDEIFNRNNFRNEIVWHYTKMNATTTNWIQNHDTILFYSKTNKWVFNIQYLNEESALKQRLIKIIDNDNKIRWKRAKTIKQQLLDSYIKSAKKRLGRELEDNDIIIDFKDKGKKKMDNVWYVPFLKGNAKEKLGYPTQKPEALLEHIIKASSNPGDVILDPFCGCGTAVVTAEKLGRKWIGIDVSPTSCNVMVDRLKKPYKDKQNNKKPGVKISEADIIDLPRTIEELRVIEPREFQVWVVKQLDGKLNPRWVDGGIDGWTYKTDNYGIRYKQVGLDACIQVKRSENIGFPEIQQFMGAMDTNNSLNQDNKTDGKHGIFVAFSFVKNAKSKLLKQKGHTGKTIELITVEELLSKHRIIQGTIT